jgi:hypothetical protein
MHGSEQEGSTRDRFKGTLIKRKKSFQIKTSTRCHSVTLSVRLTNDLDNTCVKETIEHMQKTCVHPGRNTLARALH